MFKRALRQDVRILSGHRFLEKAAALRMTDDGSLETELDCLALQGRHCWRISSNGFTSQ